MTVVVEQDHQTARRGVRRALVGLVAGVAVLLAGATPAFAGVALSVSPDPPSNLAVGQAGVPSTITVTNASSGTQSGQSVTLDDITLVPGCGTQAVVTADCPTVAADLGVLRLSASGRGLSGTACDGTTFTVSLIDAAQGKYRFTPSVPVVLGAPGTSTAACVIGYTLDAVKVPLIDADLTIPGLETDQVAYAHGVAAGGLRAAGLGSNEIAIARAVLPIATQLTPASVPIGGTFHATATLAPAAGAAVPTGNVTFSVYSPTDTTCSGPALLTSTVPLNAAGTAATSAGLTPLLAGLLPVSASYSGDVNYAPTAGTCGAAIETIAGLDEAPTAAYTPSTTRPQTGQTVSFDGTASADPDGTITAYRWVWGDGTPDGSGAKPTHVFTTPAVRSVALYVTDSDGQTAAVGHSITVIDELPTVAYTPSTYTPAVGQTVTFRATASDPDGTITAYRWVWGDGTPDGSGATATHAFATAGVRSVAVYVTDSDGQTAAAGHTITTGGG